MVIQSSYLYNWNISIILSISLRYSVTKRKEESTAYFYCKRTWNDKIKLCFRALNSSTGFQGRSHHPLSPPRSSLYLGIRRPTGRKDHGKVQRLQGRLEKVIFVCGFYNYCLVFVSLIFLRLGGLDFFVTNFRIF